MELILLFDNEVIYKNLWNERERNRWIRKKSNHYFQLTQLDTKDINLGVMKLTLSKSNFSKEIQINEPLNTKPGSLSTERPP